MLNTLATEALSSASFVDNFIDSVDQIPDDVQRVITRIRNIDIEFRGLLCDVDHFYDLAQGLRSIEMNAESRKAKRRRFLNRMHQTLIRAQEIGDEKMHLVNQMQELIDSKTRQLEVNENLDVRDEQLQQMQLSRADVSSVPIPKHLRAQSPLLADDMMGRNYQAPVDNVGRMISNIGKETSFMPYNVMPNAVTSSAEGNALAGSNILNNDIVRGNNKRSRRRNDTANDYEQFPINEGGNIMMGVANVNERSTTSRSMNVGNQKKLNAHGSGNTSVNTASSVPAVQSSNSVVGSNSATGKKKKRKTGGRHAGNQNLLQTNTREDTPPLEAIDPDEPTYCVCNQISFGEMILCDNDLCPIEWFHFSCVFLTLKPKGKWYCPNCRGDRPNVMKPKAQFLKELERYNKEKEEKM